MFGLDASQLKAVQNVLDDCINNTFGKTCKLLFPPKREVCTECSGIFSSVGTHGGPELTNSPSCAFCNNQGFKETEVSATIKMVCDFYPKEYSKLSTIDKPFAVISTRGFLTDLPKVNSCTEMLVQLPEQNFGLGRYKLWMHPGDQFSLVQGRYFVATWQRI